MTMKSYLRLLGFISCSVLVFNLSAQEEESEDAWLITPSVSLQYAGGNFAERFTSNLSVGAGFGFKTSSNWIFLAEGNFMFGNSIKQPERFISPVITSNNALINGSGVYTLVNITQRGFSVDGSVKKILPFWKANPNSGPTVSFGAGYLMHWVNIDNVEKDAPQVLDEYLKGYDRLSGGFMTRQNFGYLFLDSKRRINFELSFEFLQAFTTNFREFNYDTGQEDTGLNVDFLYSIRLNWYLPIYSKSRNAYYYD